MTPPFSYLVTLDAFHVFNAQLLIYLAGFPQQLHLFMETEPSTYSVLYSVLENYATAKPSFRSKLFLKQVEPMLELNYFWLAKSDQLNITLSDHETQYIG